MPRAYTSRHVIRDFLSSLRFAAAGSVAITSTANFAGGDFTLSAWVWPDSFGSAQTILGSASANAPVFGINTGGQLTLSLSGGATIATSTGTLYAREFAHVAVRYSGGLTRFYINGVDAGGSNTAGAFVQSANMTVGLSAGSAICELMAHASALTQSQVGKSMYLGDHGLPVMRFRFADCLGAAAVNEIGNGNGVITNASFVPWLVPMSPRCDAREYGSIKIGAGTDYVGFSANAYSSQFNGSNRLLIAAWAKINTDGIVFGARGGTVRAYLQTGHTVSFGVFRSADADGGQGAAASRHFRNANRVWHFAATLADFEAKTITNFIDGVPFDRQAVTFGANALTLTSGDCRMGQDPNGTSAMVGLIGPVYVCGGNVTWQMVRDLYLKGSIPNVDRVAYWDMVDRSSSTLVQKGNRGAMGAALAGGAAWSMEGPL